MGEDPSFGEALLAMVLAGATATGLGAAVLLPVIGLVIWAGSTWKRKRRTPREE